MASLTILISSSPSFLPTGNLISTRLYPNSSCVPSHYKAIKAWKYRIIAFGQRVLVTLLQRVHPTTLILLVNCSFTVLDVCNTPGKTRSTPIPAFHKIASFKLRVFFNATAFRVYILQCLSGKMKERLTPTAHSSPHHLLHMQNNTG